MKRNIALTCFAALALTGCGTNNANPEPTPTATTPTSTEPTGKPLAVNIKDWAPFEVSKNNGDGTCELTTNVDVGVYLDRDQYRFNNVAFGTMPAGTKGERAGATCFYTPAGYLPAKPWGPKSVLVVEYTTPLGTYVKRNQSPMDGKVFVTLMPETRK